jgi:hypothetical protein
MLRSSHSCDHAPHGEEVPVLVLGGGWFASSFTADQWREEVRSGPLQEFASFDAPTPYVYVISKATPSSQPTVGETGTFVAPIGVPEDTPEALYVALINAQAHEALEWVQFNGKPYFDPHTEVGDYVLEGALIKLAGMENRQKSFPGRVRMRVQFRLVTAILTQWC